MDEQGIEIESVDDEAVLSEHGPVATYVLERFNRAQDNRREQEERWVEAYLNYRGLPHVNNVFKEDEESDVFIKVTKTKVLAAYGIIHEIMFPNSGNKFPIMVKPTPIPEGVEEAVHIDPKAPPKPEEQEMEESDEFDSPYGFPGDGKDLEPGYRFNLGTLQKKLKPVEEKLEEGTGGTPTSLNFFPAQEAAEFMDKKMQDQLQEGAGHEALRRALFDSVLYGTGVIKGPFAVEKEYPYWEPQEDGPPLYRPVKQMIPTYEHIRLLDVYVDPEAYGEDDLEYVVIDRRMSAHQLRNLKKRSLFRSEAIDTALENGPSYEQKWWETDINDDSQNENNERYEVYEFWGIVGREDFEDDDDLFSQIDIPEEYEDADEFNVSIWVCNGQVLKFAFNPYMPERIPFHFFRYEYNPNNFFGVGLAENMSDTQLLMNGFMRMAIDNAAKSGDLVFEIAEDYLVPGQDLTIESGKVFRRQGGAPGQAIFAHKFQNTTQENMMMFDKARQLSDESTGFPSFAHGQTGITGVGRTASGISMLMGAASTNIKTVIKNYDNGLEKLARSLFEYNMTFDFDERALGDVTVCARGTDALMSSEIRSQRLAMFMQQASNQVMAPHVRWPYMLREIAKSLDLDPDKLLNNAEEAQYQALLMQMQGMGGPQSGGAPGAPQPPNGPAGAQAQDTQGSGGGVPGVGVPQVPGTPGFTGNDGGGGGEVPQ